MAQKPHTDRVSYEKAGKSFAATRNVGNAITGASAGAAVGVIAGPVGAVVGAVMGLVANVAVGVWADNRRKAPKIGTAFRKAGTFKGRRQK